MQAGWRKWNRVAGLVALALAVVVHAALKWHLAGTTAAAAVFTLGGGASAWPVLEVGALVVLRLFLVLALPGILLAEAGQWIVGVWRERRAACVLGPGAPPATPESPGREG